MNLEKYTQKSQEALLAAQHLAQDYQHQVVEPIHLLLAERGYQLVISPEARAYLAEVGYDADYGARPLKRAIQRELQDPLAVKILGSEFHEGETIHVERGKERLEFTALASDQLVAP